MEALRFFVTSITHRLPGFISKPAEALVSEKCYRSLVLDFDLSDTECIKYSLSKGLGLGIVLGGGIVKIPQIIKIVSSGSARGLSLSAFALDSAACAFSLAYSARNHFPFSTYGENAFLTVQNVIIALLIIWYSPNTALSAQGGARPLSGIGGSVRAKGNLQGLLVGLAITVVMAIWLSSEKLTSIRTLSILQAATFPVSILAKTPQIISNYRLRSTGNLSAFAVFNSLAGCLARLFTTSQETGDSLVFAGFAIAALLNAILAVQMLLYWHDDKKAQPVPIPAGREIPLSPMTTGTDYNQALHIKRGKKKD